MISLFKRFFEKSNASLEQAIKKPVAIIDVRSESEFSQGHIRGSKNIPLHELKAKTEIIRKWDLPVVTVCRSGYRSATAAEILQAAGIEVYNGGAWTSLNTKF